MAKLIRPLYSRKQHARRAAAGLPSGVATDGATSMGASDVKKAATAAVDADPSTGEAATSKAAAAGRGRKKGNV
jgi:hypothetical protein